MAHAYLFSLLAGALDVEFAIYATTSEASAQLGVTLFGSFLCRYLCCPYEPSVVYV
jgi:hypothetical protein